ncbi:MULTISPECIES: DUF1176 domain-containing protein [Microvirga]|uniref:DUF1176 domain-containing protein n=1 Tax=Microvirga TaxID=186650 RepID=UPI001D001366|nr:DUF1176 domain-containing protein [Microvirga lenta]MCB5176147.1 DUF1176 domain-containing protein [Microvirga lenta]
MQRRLPLALTLAPLALAAVATPVLAQQKPSGAASQVQPLKQFKDWTIGCDNVRNCTALGLSPDESMMGPYVKIDRAGTAAATPEVTFVAIPDDDVKVADPGLKLTLDGKDIPGLSAQPLKASADGDLVRATLPAEQVGAFIAALRNGTNLNLQLLDGTKEAANGTVSLAGSAAALLYMDDQQKRIGTVTALARKGDAPASSIPAQPDLPVVAAKRMTEIDGKAKPPLPAGIVRPKDGFCTDGYPDIVIKLSPSQTLWGVCSQAAAYNFDYEFYVAGQGRPKPAAFTAPGFAQERGASVLTSPGLADDGMTIGSFAKGRGLGDCGVITEWAWDGTAFRPMNVSMMGACRGVSADDWPVLFQAKRG